MLKKFFYKFIYKTSEYSQAGQDLFAYELFGKAGTYVDVGSGEPKRGNNTFILETLYNWKGFSVDIGHSNSILKKEIQKTSASSITQNKDHICEIYNLFIYSDYALKFYDEIGFRLERKQNNKIKLEGYLNEIKLKKWFESLDLYIQASSGEEMSTSLLQAMSMKVPVLGSDVIGINNFLCKDKYLGLLFKNNVSDLSTKIKYFYFLDKKIQNKYAVKQRKYILENHNCEIMFKSYLSLMLK
jgi:glycosyltransferase involved in cell wall biosynthesis